MRIFFLIAMNFMSSFMIISCNGNDTPDEVIHRIDGYRGIWDASMASDDEYRYTYYSGGLGTYTAKHRPSAYYSNESEKTFFCYGGLSENGERLVQMVSWYDHKTGTVPKPVALPDDKKTGDAHDNPAIMLDDKGHIWVFASAHGRVRNAYIYKSSKPYSIDSFEMISKTNFSYPQPWYIPGRGFLFLYTLYKNGRHLYWSTSPDGIDWTEPEKLATIDEGHYQISWLHEKKVGTALNYHPTSTTGGNWNNPEQPGVDPSKSGTNNRTNLYYLETIDFGDTWRTVDGTVVRTPLTSPDSPALVHDYYSEELLVYLKDIAFDSNGRPVILFLTSHGSESGPQNDPRTWRSAYWYNGKWRINDITTSDNNYDAGSIYVDKSDGTWMVIAPTGKGPQPYNSGGEIERWVSTDKGTSWQKAGAITFSSEYNHTYVKKPLYADDNFYGLWADGSGRKKSQSQLYFCDKEGITYCLPEKMTADVTRPANVFQSH